MLLLLLLLVKWVFCHIFNIIIIWKVKQNRLIYWFTVTSPAGETNLCIWEWRWAIYHPGTRGSSISRPQRSSCRASSSVSSLLRSCPSRSSRPWGGWRATATNRASGTASAAPRRLQVARSSRQLCIDTLHSKHTAGGFVATCGRLQIGSNMLKSGSPFLTFCKRTELA